MINNNSVENERIELPDGRVIHNSRSVDSAIFLFRHTKKDGKVSILAIRRGKDSDEGGKWSVPCGYLNYNETILECGYREFYEETGYDISNRDDLATLAYIDDDPNSNKRQNITHCYVVNVYDDHYYVECDDLNRLIHTDDVVPILSGRNEIDKIEWISLDDVYKRDWAYDSNKMLIKAYSNTH